MPTIDMYGNGNSSPCRAVWMTCRALGVDVNIIETKATGETRTPEFLKMNHYHCLPTINDDSFVLWESRTIMRYLVSKYGKTDDLYPKDPQKRALVERLMDYDAATLYAAFLPVCYWKILFGAEPPMGSEKRVEELMDELEANSALWDSDFMTGPVPTLADISTMASLGFLEPTQYDFTRFPNINAWRERMMALSYYAPTHASFEKFKQFALTPQWKQMQAARRAAAAEKK